MRREKLFRLLAMPVLLLNFNGRTILETIYQDGYLRFNNGWFIVEVDDYSLYVDVTGQYIKEFGIGDYEIIDSVICE